MPNTEQQLYQNEKKHSPEVFCKNPVLKNFVIFTGKHLYEIYNNAYLEEHLRMDASEPTS